jgi:hypothetical protein
MRPFGEALNNFKMNFRKMESAEPQKKDNIKEAGQHSFTDKEMKNRKKIQEAIVQGSKERNVEKVL